MPKVSVFMGIIITFNYKDHLPPHFHAEYNGKKASFNINTFKRMNGELPSRIVGLILEWASMYQEELMENWERAVSMRPVKPIKPLVE